MVIDFSALNPSRPIYHFAYNDLFRYFSYNGALMGNSRLHTVRSIIAEALNFKELQSPGGDLLCCKGMINSSFRYTIFARICA